MKEEINKGQEVQTTVKVCGVCSYLLGDPILYDGGGVHPEQAFPGQTADQACDGFLAALGGESKLLLFVIDHLLQSGGQAERFILSVSFSVVRSTDEHRGQTYGKRPSMTLRLRTASTIRFFLLSSRYVS